MGTRHRFLTLDVFTSTRFGGNQLAVLPDARGLTSEQMLAVTREFNYSESVFVLPAERAGSTRRLRIFTPGGEIPFAGHPTVGTAHALAASGEIPLTAGASPDEATETAIIFDEGVGPVPVRIRARGNVPEFCQLSVAKLPETGAAPPDVTALAGVLSLDARDLLGGAYAPEAVSCGLPFLFVPLRSRDAVRRARVRLDAWDGLLKGTWGSEIMVFALGDESGAAPHDPRDADVHARVFVPGLNVPEDPATGSACAALGGYLAARTPRDNATLRWSVSQGVDMGRPSRIEIEVDKRAGATTAVRVGGASVMVSEGTILV